MCRSAFGETIESHARAERAAEESYLDTVRCSGCGEVAERLIAFADGEAVEDCERCECREVERP